MLDRLRYAGWVGAVGAVAFFVTLSVGAMCSLFIDALDSAVPRGNANPGVDWALCSKFAGAVAGVAMGLLGSALLFAPEEGG